MTYLVDGIYDPVNAGIATDSLVLRVDQDNLVVLVGRILVDPVRVEHPQVGTTTANTFFSSGLEGALVLQLVYTLVGGLACIEEISVCTRLHPCNGLISPETIVTYHR